MKTMVRILHYMKYEISPNLVDEEGLRIYWKFHSKQTLWRDPEITFFTVWMKNWKFVLGFYVVFWVWFCLLVNSASSHLPKEFLWSGIFVAKNLSFFYCLDSVMTNKLTEYFKSLLHSYWVWLGYSYFMKLLLLNWLY